MTLGVLNLAVTFHDANMIQAEGNLNSLGAGDFLLTVDPNYRRAKIVEMHLTLGAVAIRTCPPEQFLRGFDPTGNIICAFVDGCGNGILNVGEICDDGNTFDYDGCSASCIDERCGNGVLQANIGEECDDGNTANGDGCSAICLLEAVTPVISNVVPSVIIIESGQVQITVAGTGFIAQQSVVIFDGQVLQPIIISSIELTFTIDTNALALGLYNVTVSNGAGNEYTLAAAIEIIN